MKIRHLLLACLFLAGSAVAQDYEYRVVYLGAAMEVSGKGLTFRVKEKELPVHPSGAVIDQDKSAALNALAAEGWEVIGVTGAVGADHAIYLRRPMP